MKKDNLVVRYSDKDLGSFKKIIEEAKDSREHSSVVQDIKSRIKLKQFLCFWLFSRIILAAFFQTQQ